jgi:uncharacterized protein
MNNALLDYALKTSVMDPRGDHHLEHWISVHTYGMLIGQQNGADLEVVSAFALLHDVARVDEHIDPMHGERAAKLLQTGRAGVQRQDGRVPGLFKLSDTQMVDLTAAIEHHNMGLVTDNVTIGTCWDADRLDLPRVHIMPSPKLMSTEMGKEIARGLSKFL